MNESIFKGCSNFTEVVGVGWIGRYRGVLYMVLVLELVRYSKWSFLGYLWEQWRSMVNLSSSSSIHDGWACLSLSYISQNINLK